MSASAYFFRVVVYTADNVSVVLSHTKVIQLQCNPILSPLLFIYITFEPYVDLVKVHGVPWG